MTDVDGLLDVYLHGAKAGVLERRSQAQLRFSYLERWIADGGPPLSLSLPVRPEPFDHEECAPFFEGLLPEGDFLRAIARTLHVSATNPFQLLSDLGGECAGAISVGPVGGPVPGEKSGPPKWLSEPEVGVLLTDLPRRPLLAAVDEAEGGDGIRLSLAGAQDKVGVLAKGEEIGLSYGRPPTTAILKAPIPHVEESVVNEAFCMALAARSDLEVAAAAPRTADSHEYLLVDRFDRNPETVDGRVHQEDFCQALGLVPAVKYEKEGGPGVADCAALIRSHCSAPARDITAFLDALLFNFVIANYDAHSKNYTLLLDGPGAIRLSPLYDLLSTAVFRDTDRKLAMKYGGENRPNYVRGRHLDRMAADLGVKPALVRRRAVLLAERVGAAIGPARESLPTEFQGRPMLDRIVEMVAERGEELSARAREDGEETSVVPGGGSADAWPLGGPAESLVAGFDDVSRDLDRVIDLFNQGLGRDVEEVLPQLDFAARELKSHGRTIYDGVVDFESSLGQTLDRIEVKSADDEFRRRFLDLLTGFADKGEEWMRSIEDVYGGLENFERVTPGMRAPTRNMRAGLRDMLDAITIILEWGERAAALATDED